MVVLLRFNWISGQHPDHVKNWLESWQGQGQDGDIPHPPDAPLRPECEGGLRPQHLRGAGAWCRLDEGVLAVSIFV